MKNFSLYVISQTIHARATMCFVEIEIVVYTLRHPRIKIHSEKELDGPGRFRLNFECFVE